MCCGSQPVSAVAEPDSSSAWRKAWPTNGLSAPAQASHSAAGISPRPSMMRIARRSLPSIASPGSSLFDFEDRVDLHRHAVRQRRDADGDSRMTPGIAQHLDHQVGAAVDDLRLLDEIRQRVDEAVDAQALLDAVEIAVERRLDMRQDIEAADARRRLAVGLRDGAAELADEARLAVPLRQLARDEEDIAAAGEGRPCRRHVIRLRPGRLGQLDLKLLQPRFDPSGHPCLAWVIGGHFTIARCRLPRKSRPPQGERPASQLRCPCPGDKEHRYYASDGTPVPVPRLGLWAAAPGSKAILAPIWLRLGLRLANPKKPSPPIGGRGKGEGAQRFDSGRYCSTPAASCRWHRTGPP